MSVVMGIYDSQFMIIQGDLQNFNSDWSIYYLYPIMSDLVVQTETFTKHLWGSLSGLRDCVMAPLFRRDTGFQVF